MFDSKDELMKMQNDSMKELEIYKSDLPVTFISGLSDSVTFSISWEFSHTTLNFPFETKENQIFKGSKAMTYRPQKYQILYFLGI